MTALVVAALSFAALRSSNACSVCRCGDLLLVTVGYERSLGKVLGGVVKADLRDAAEDRNGGSGQHDPDTGGRMLYLTSRLLLRLSPGLVGRVTVQVPVAESLNGD